MLQGRQALMNKVRIRSGSRRNTLIEPIPFTSNSSRAISANRGQKARLSKRRLRLRLHTRRRTPGSIPVLIIALSLACVGRIPRTIYPEKVLNLRRDMTGIIGMFLCGE